MSELAPLTSHTTGETRRDDTSFGSQNQRTADGSRATRQDLSTIGSEPYGRGGYSIRRLGGHDRRTRPSVRRVALGLKGATLGGALFVGRASSRRAGPSRFRTPFAPQDFRSHPIRTPESGSLADSPGHRRSLVGAV